MSNLCLYQVEQYNARTGARTATVRGLNHFDIMELLEGYTSTGSAPRWIFTKPGSRFRYVVTAY